VVFVTTDPRLKKDVRKIKDYNIDDLAFNDEFTMEENETNSNLDASNEDILVEVREDQDASGRVDVPMNDLKIPQILDESHRGHDFNEN